MGVQSCLTLGDPMDCSLPARLLCLWNSPGKNSGVGHRYLLQRIFHLHHRQVASFPLRPLGSPMVTLGLQFKKNAFSESSELGSH